MAFHSESITNSEKSELVKELVRKLKLEDHYDHKNWETPEADGYGNRYELRSEFVTKYVESNRNSLRVMVTELYHTQKRVHEPPYFSTMLVGGKNTPIYNLDVSLISDFLDSLMTESMIVAALCTAETGGRRPIW